MKLKVSEILVIDNALVVASREKLTAKENYAIAKNLKKTNKIVREYSEDNEIRIDSFVQKNEKGEPIIKDNKYDFGKNHEDAKKKLEELLNKEVEFEPYIIKYNDEFGKIPAEALHVLFDVIIEDTEKPQ